MHNFLTHLAIMCVSDFKGVQNRTNQIENCKSNQFKLKPLKTTFSLEVFESFPYSTTWFGLVRGFCFTNRTKPNRNIRETIIKHISLKPIFIKTQ